MPDIYHNLMGCKENSFVKLFLSNLLTNDKMFNYSRSNLIVVKSQTVFDGFLSEFEG